MIQSMTGYGKSTSVYRDKKITVEIRALNSKGFDLYLKAPQYFKEKEMPIRKLISEHLHRGKIEAVITIENENNADGYTINKMLAKHYYKTIKSIAKDVDADEQQLLATVIRLPDVLKQEEHTLQEQEWLTLKKLVEEAIDQLIQFRQQEGKVITNDFTNWVNTIDQLLSEVPSYEKARISAVRERIKSGLSDLGENVDENRFEQEVLFYIEKLDVSEEISRLQNHLNYFKETMSNEEPVGKKLGFISQEIGREINTLGSKAQNADLQKIVVNMKDNLERIKEQVLNTL